MVPEVGIEPTWGKPRWILSPVRLPVSPLRPKTFYIITNEPELSRFCWEHVRAYLNSRALYDLFIIYPQDCNHPWASFFCNGSVLENDWYRYPLPKLRQTPTNVTSTRPKDPRLLNLKSRKNISMRGDWSQEKHRAFFVYQSSLRSRERIQVDGISR